MILLIDKMLGREIMYKKFLRQFWFLAATGVGDSQAVRVYADPVLVYM